jgi:hypothetical protein
MSGLTSSDIKELRRLARAAVPRLTGWPGIKELNAFEEAATPDTMLKLIEIIMEPKP